MRVRFSLSPYRIELRSGGALQQTYFRPYLQLELVKMAEESSVLDSTHEARGGVTFPNARYQTGDQPLL